MFIASSTYWWFVTLSVRLMQLVVVLFLLYHRHKALRMWFQRRTVEKAWLKIRSSSSQNSALRGKLCWSDFLLQRDTNARHNVRLNVLAISELRSYKLRENAHLQNASRSVFQYDVSDVRNRYVFSVSDFLRRHQCAKIRWVFVAHRSFKCSVKARCAV